MCSFAFGETERIEERETDTTRIDCWTGRHTEGTVEMNSYGMDQNLEDKPLARMGRSLGESRHGFTVFHGFLDKGTAMVERRTDKNTHKTPRRTHIFLSVAHLITDHHTHVRLAQVLDAVHLCAP